MKYYFTCTSMARTKKVRLKSVCEDVEKPKPLYTAGRNIKRCSYSGKQAGSTLKQLDRELLCEPARPSLCIHPRTMRIYVHTKTCTQIFIAALLWVAEKEKQPNVHHLTNG